MGDLHARGVRRVLELGSNPYFLTVLLRRRFDFDLELANYFGGSLENSRYTHVATLDGKPIEFPYSHFNIEVDPFPYEDRSLDCVLFCEILEHLLIDPDRAVGEMARIVKPGGFLVISTPNATRLTKLYSWPSAGTSTIGTRLRPLRPSQSGAPLDTILCRGSTGTESDVEPLARFTSARLRPA